MSLTDSRVGASVQASPAARQDPAVRLASGAPPGSLRGRVRLGLATAVGLACLAAPGSAAPRSAAGSSGAAEPGDSPGRAEARADWLVHEGAFEARVLVAADSVTLENGLLRRVIRLRPDAATVALDNLSTGESLLRATKPEAHVRLDGLDFDIGGLQGQPDHAFLLTEWLPLLREQPESFHYVGQRVGETRAPFAWKRARGSEERPWPPPGVSLELDFRLGPRVPLAPSGLEPSQVQARLARLRALTVTLRYELYSGIPLLGKQLLIHNAGSEPVRLESFTSEILAVVEAESRVEGSERWRPPKLDVISDFAFGGMSPINSDKVVHWLPDPEYLTQVNYRRLSPVLLETRLPAGPDVDIAAGESFESFRVFELLHDSSERERMGLARRRMYRTLAPWVTENPLMMHIRSAQPEAVRLALDQCAAVGFEMAILTFGSGFDIESEDPAYLDQLAGLADYAHEHGVQLGGYSLLASRRISDEQDVVDRETGECGHAFFGNSPCLGSSWGRDYFRKLYAFFERTGFDLLEHDGSYPGDFCASTQHPGHVGWADSQWRQWLVIRDFYRWCRQTGVFLNVPDFYVLNGSNKTGMGYRETNWSLPRELQPLHGRQNVFDGTWEKPPSMGWMFVPLTEYQGGGEAATIEPLREHLDAYESHLAYNLGLGVQACWRGPRLFDSPETEALLKRWVDFYKRHRAILESDLLHLRRADGRDLDYMLHVNPRHEERALLMVFNPLASERTKRIRVPLYYAGLAERVRVQREDGSERELTLERDYSLELEVTVAPRSQTWLVFGAAE